MWGVPDFEDRDPVPLPPVTRRLLGPDGATARLPEALVGSALAVDAVEQWRSSSAPPHVAAGAR